MWQCMSKRAEESRGHRLSVFIQVRMCCCPRYRTGRNERYSLGTAKLPRPTVSTNRGRVKTEECSYRLHAARCDVDKVPHVLLGIHNPFCLSAERRKTVRTKWNPSVQTVRNAEHGFITLVLPSAEVAWHHSLTLLIEVYSRGPAIRLWGLCQPPSK
ncbi:hypothetical protein ElyMa_003814900 [Elysia marginata]|uniref:Hexosyltransferase n=1 Tax=Elysia marginata TaxID=1093978 RepID=A0AAV4FGF7_9GAST|nr:hypothetical protein ElyMa_003814900 [Elysia marginata]